MPTDLPLDGVTVVTLAVNVPGPVACARLLALGARVVKVEPPQGDPLELYSADWCAELRRGMDVRPLDLKAPDDRAALDTLLDEADVLVTAHRTASLERLGLGWEVLHARLPGLVHVAIVGHPAPDDDVAGHDLTYQATSGTLSPPDDPAMPAVLAADLAGAERAVSEALAGLVLRDRTGEGTRREVALSTCAEELAAPVRHGLTLPTGILGGDFPGYAIYPASEGHVALAALEPHFWARAQELFGADDHDGVARALRGRTAHEWEQVGEERDVPMAAVREPGTRL